MTKESYIPQYRIKDLDEIIQAIADVIEAVSEACVHKEGQETIDGAKTFTSSTTFNGQVTSSNIIPKSNNQYNIGTADLAYSNVYGTYFSGTSYRAYWGDLAENYVSDEIYPSGLLIQFGGDKEITKAVTKVNGVISSQPAFVLNDAEGGLPVALCGRVPVMIEGKINKFDKLCLSKTCGVARKKKWYEFWKHTIASALESKYETEIKDVLCVTKCNLD